MVTSNYESTIDQELVNTAV